MDAVAALHTLMQRIDERRWDALESLLHPDFRTRLVHTGEQFDRTGWIRLNAEYPGFDRLVLEQITGNETTAACRTHVTGRDGDRVQHFECAMFVTLDGGLIREMTEVWTDVDQTTPPGTRPKG